MKRFKVVAEKNHGARELPGAPRSIFDQSLRCRIEQREWASMEAENEDEIRQFFAQGQKDELAAVQGFTITSIEELP